MSELKLSVEQRSAALALEHLLRLVKLCRSTADEIGTDDAETLDELVRTLDIAEICLLRLQAGRMDIEADEAPPPGSAIGG
ncbi:MAG TPA: hypothetical protein VEA80_17500 [Vitreimonas sp.]|uniref:hypothetical protein n=1 Tax=Vitreimonas sp. TaxID=3069702 RepID=UPI002D27FE27|nr:hypothetical protein [Vitreimonas sp.]HYD89278.1 hypothetical protein [Vitreimonas sp.]